MPRKDDSTLMYRIAKLYYLQNVQQTDIAQMEGLSRSTVSRLLEKARRCGIVSIDVKLPRSVKSAKMEQDLRKLLRLKEVIVAPVSVAENIENNEMQILRDVGCVAAEHMPRLLTGARYVGLGWGRSLYVTASELSRVREQEQKFFVPMVCNFSNNVPYLQTSAIVGMFSERFGAEGYYLNISSPEHVKGQRTDEEKKDIHQLCVYWNVLDAAVLSVASPNQLVTSPLYRDVWRDGIDPVSEGEKRAIFESMGQVFFSDGSYYGVNRNFDMISMDLQRLKEIETVICVAGGASKAQALITAGIAGFYNVLIIDHLTAETMLRMMRSGGKVRAERKIQ